MFNNVAFCKFKFNETLVAFNYVQFDVVFPHVLFDVTFKVVELDAVKFVVQFAGKTLIDDDLEVVDTILVMFKVFADF